MLHWVAFANAMMPPVVPSLGGFPPMGRLLDALEAHEREHVAHVTAERLDIVPTVVRRREAAWQDGTTAPVLRGQRP